jgi:predicted phosphodiesterase
VTRVVILSDIHGNLAALEAVAAHLPASDRVIVAGDLCLEGPHPAEVLDRLADLGWELLTGNTDRDLVEVPAEAKRKKREIIAWTRERLGAERLERLAALPFSQAVTAGGRNLALVVHANPLNLEDQLYPTLSEEELQPYLEAAGAPLLAFGHLHIPYVRPVRGTLLIDVSSVGHPKDQDRRAAYTVVEWEGEQRSVTQVRVPYDIERTVEALRRSDMPHADEEAEALLQASY